VTHLLKGHLRAGQLDQARGKLWRHLIRRVVCDFFHENKKKYAMPKIKLRRERKGGGEG
jgi:hypothetical protein